MCQALANDVVNDSAWRGNGNNVVMHKSELLNLYKHQLGINTKSIVGRTEFTQNLYDVFACICVLHFLFSHLGTFYIFVCASYKVSKILK